jgi:hypothetical protein
MSGYGPKADIGGLFDHLVGAPEGPPLGSGAESEVMHTTHIVHLPFPLALGDLDDPRMKKAGRP